MRVAYVRHVWSAIVSLEANIAAPRYGYCSAMLLLAGYRPLGAAGVLVGLVVFVFARRLAEAMAALERADADFVDKHYEGRTAEIASIWMRSGARDAPGSRWLHRYITRVVGMAILFVGLAALLGAWDQ